MADTSSNPQWLQSPNYPIFMTFFANQGNAEEAAQVYFSLGQYLLKHGTAAGFCWPLPWWQDKVAPFVCHRKPGMGWYASPAATPPYKTSTDVGELNVLMVVGDWFFVYRYPDGREIWVKAEETQP